MKNLSTPLTKDKVISLHAGDEIFITGKIYTARDAAHKMLVESIKKGENLPFNLKNQIIYYAGPTPAPPGYVIGSCGPTTSKRMDSCTIPLLEKGLKGMIGKGERRKEVENAIKKFKAVYFIAVGGAGAFLATRVKKAKLIAYPELGPEAIYELEVENFPVIVAIDSNGGNIFKNRDNFTK